MTVKFNTSRGKVMLYRIWHAGAQSKTLVKLQPVNTENDKPGGRMYTTFKINGSALVVAFNNLCSANIPFTLYMSALSYNRLNMLFWNPYLQPLHEVKFSTSHEWTESILLYEADAKGTTAAAGSYCNTGHTGNTSTRINKTCISAV